MAKKKIKTMPGEGSGEEVETQTIDIPEGMAERLHIGQKIVVTMTGEIGMINTPPEDGMGEPYIGIRIISKKIAPEGGNEFSKLADADDSDDEED
jgi:hypothetical protein